MYTGFLIGYFGRQDEARKACRQLRRKGYRRAAWASKTADGDVHIGDPFPLAPGMWSHCSLLPLRSSCLARSEPS